MRILQASIVVGIVALPQGSSGDESIRPILATPLDDVPASAYAQMATCPKQMPLPRRQPAVAPERFVLTRCHGGINQQRVQIAESAAAAYYLNATLIVPELLVHHWWNDSFRFEEIFDEQYFVQQMRRIGSLLLRRRARTHCRCCRVSCAQLLKPQDNLIDEVGRHWRAGQPQLLHHRRREGDLRLRLVP